MSIYRLDLQRYNGKSYVTRFLFWLRFRQTTKSRVLKLVSKVALRHYRDYYGLDLGNGDNIGPGFYLGHAWNITINPKARIGCNCNIHKGVVIGQTFRGITKGTPTIGNEVWIGANAAIVGGITIGDDVLISPNTFVNSNIPSHSVVFGNPCIIKHRDYATEGYINHKANIDY